jgi:hypothetical protein
MTGLYSSRVAPFGYPRINPYSQVPVAFRSLLRPSSLPDARAFTVRPYYLDPYFFPSVVKEHCFAGEGFNPSPAKRLKTKSRLRLISILRKEVIQPQVPLRLPCYDFTPITGHTLGTCIPCGLAQ